MGASGEECVVPPGEAALVTQDGLKRLALVLPNLHGMEEVPTVVVFLTAIMARFDTDPVFVRQQLEWFAALSKD